MPNLQAVVTLQPYVATIVHSKQTQQVAKNLVRAIQLADLDIETSTLKIKDANSAQAVIEALKTLPPGWALSYTGGTKIMAAHARRVYDTHGDGREHHASIVDNAIVYDDGTTQPLDAKGVNIRSIAQLHGHHLVHGHAPQPYSQVLDARLDLEARLTDAYTPMRALHNKTRGRIRTSLGRSGGFWLEELAGAALAEENDEVLLSSTLYLNGEPQDAPELDVLVRNGWNTTLLSCTVTHGQNSRPTQKLKFMEAITRAKQLGGDRARAGLVILNNEQRRKSLIRDLEPNLGFEPIVYSHRHVREWLHGTPTTRLPAH